MDDWLRFILSLGWGAIGHLYSIVYKLPTSERVDALEREIDELRRQVSEERRSAARNDEAP